MLKMKRISFKISPRLVISICILIWFGILIAALNEYGAFSVSAMKEIDEQAVIGTEQQTTLDVAQEEKQIVPSQEEKEPVRRRDIDFIWLEEQKRLEEQQEEPMGKDINTEIYTLWNEFQENFSEEERYLFQQVDFAEAGYDVIDAQIGVICVIMNRMDCPDFPDTIHDIVFQKNQFSTAQNGGIYFSDWHDADSCDYRQVNQSDIDNSTVPEAFVRAFNGENPIGTRECFYAPKWCSEEKLKKMEGITDKIQIGDLIFYGEHEH